MTGCQRLRTCRHSYPVCIAVTCSIPSKWHWSNSLPVVVQLEHRKHPILLPSLFFRNGSSKSSVVSDSFLQSRMSEEESSAITSFLGEHQPLHHLLLSSLKNTQEGVFSVSFSDVQNGITTSILKDICNSVVHQMDHLEYIPFPSSFVALLRKVSPLIICIV